MEKEKRYKVEFYNVEDNKPIWRVTDDESGFAVLWVEHQFNETQQVFVPTDGREFSAVEVARIMREIGDYLAEHHREIIF